MIIEAREDVVKLEGTLDKNLWPTIQAAANLLLRHHPQGIIVDGSGLLGCSAEGAKTFRDAMDYIERYRAHIVVSALPDGVMEVIRAVPGVRSRLPVAATIEEARASLNLSKPGGGRATAGGDAPQNILVPLLRPDDPQAAAALACRLARADPSHKSRLHLVYVLEVPRHLPLAAPLPEEEAEAARTLAAAARCASGAGVTVEPHVTRARDAGEEIVAQATSLGASLIVLTYLPSGDPSDTLMARTARTVLDRAPCEVVLDKQAAR